MKDAKEQLKNRVAVSKGTSNDFSIERRSLNFEKNKIGLQTRSSSNDAYIQFLKSTKKRGS